jgi:hypothetical protein
MNRWKIVQLLALPLLAVLVGGCAWSDAGRNLENSDRLRVGMTKEEVQTVMGEPQRDEVFTKPDVWFYYIRPNWIDGLVTEEECMPLVFSGGKLIGWGNEFYANYRLASPGGK